MKRRVLFCKVYEQQRCSGIIAEKEKRKCLQDEESKLGTLLTEKALVIHLRIEESKLGFEVNLK